jgi:hypothetical protein
MNPIVAFLIGTGIFALIVFIILMFIESTRCPVCKKTFVVKHLGKEETGCKKGYRIVKREERNRKGKVIREWDEQIRVLTVDYLHSHSCSNCGHAWTTTSSVEHDSFDDE